MKSSIAWPEKSTFELIINIPAQTIGKAENDALNELTKSVNIPGFRKGKAPLDMVKKSIKEEDLFQKIIEKVVPQAYLDSLKKHNLNPIIDPKIEILKADKDKDWQIKATSCTAPQVELGNWKDEIKKQNSKEKIWVPGKEDKNDFDQEKKKQLKLNQIIEKLNNVVKVDIPSLIIQKEVNKKITGLVDQLQKAGMTVEEYLNSKKTTIENIRAEYAQEIKSQFKIELVLEKISDEEKITVSKDEIEEFKQKILKNDGKKDQNINEYFVAQLLRRQKTLAYLLNL